MSKNGTIGQGWYAWINWGIASLFFLYQYTLFLSFGVIASKVQSTFAISATIFGVLTALCTIVYGICQLPAGALLDRMSVRALLPSCCGVAAVGAVVYGLSPNVYISGLGSFLMGAGMCLSFVGAIYIANQWFEPKIFGLIAGLTVAIGCIGGAIMQQVLAALLQHFGWRTIMIGIAVSGGILTFLLFIIVREKTASPADKDDTEKTSSPQPSVSLIKALKIVAGNWQIWLAGIFSGLILGQIVAFGTVWNIPYQMSFYHSLAKSVMVNSFVFVGFGLGAPAIGWISDGLFKRIWPMRICAVIVLIIMVCLLQMPLLSQWTIALFMFVLGFFAGGSNLSYALGVENSPAPVNATALGFVASLSFIFGAFLQFFPGVLLGPLHPAAATGTGPDLYAVSHYRYAFIVFPICSVLAILITFLLRETHCKSQVE